jgi:hypothetical protein
MSVMPDYIAGMMMKLKNKDYLPVSARILWFRGDHPEWGIEREIVEIDHQANYAIVSVCIRNEDGRILSQATKREDKREFGDYLEKAETGALGRALAYLGYGTLSPEDDTSAMDGGGKASRMVDSPQRTPEAPQKDWRNKGGPTPNPKYTPVSELLHTSEDENDPLAPAPVAAKSPQLGRVTEALRGGQKLPEKAKPKVDPTSAECPYPVIGDLLRQIHQLGIANVDNGRDFVWKLVTDFVPNVKADSTKWPSESYCEKMVRRFISENFYFVDDAGFICPEEDELATEAEVESGGESVEARL